MPLALDALVNQPELLNERAQSLDWEELLFEYELALDDVQAWLRGLNEAQIHFKASEKDYSIAEIVTHNAFGDEMLWSWIALLVTGRSTEIDPRTLISGHGAHNAATRLDLEALNEACRTLARQTIDSLSAAPDLAATAPHFYFGALNAKGWVYFMAVHRAMHRYQCENVIATPGFPRSPSMQAQPREVYQPSGRKTWLKQGVIPKERIVRSKKQGPAGKTQSVKSTAAKKHATSKKKTGTRSK